MHKIWIGTSGFNYASWQGDFYPENLAKSKWLPYYSSRFKTVEINATFYGSFKRETYQKWASQTPENFNFAIKGPRFISHILRINPSPMTVGVKKTPANTSDSVKKFFDSAAGLGNKLGVVLWQFSPGFKNTEENFERLNAFLKLLPSNTKQAFEFRHDTWFDNKVYRLLNQNKAGIVISESSRFPEREIVVGEVCYIRFHGPTSLYSSSYSTQQLEEWGRKIKKWSSNAEVYCYFNNDSGGHAFRNAAELEELVTRS